MQTMRSPLGSPSTSSSGQAPYVQRATSLCFPQQRTGRVASSRAPTRAAAPPQNPRLRLKIAVDVDEVLGRFLFALNQYCREEHGLDHEVGDFWIYEFAKIWGCDQDRSNEIVHAFFKSPHFKDGIPTVPGAYEALQKLKAHHDLVVVTSRQHVIEESTMRWLNTHFPDTFSEVHFGNHFAMEGKSRKKSEICQSINAHVLIDDNPKYAYDCATNGMRVLLFNWNMEYRWAELTPQLAHENISVVADWDEVEVQLSQAALLEQPR